MLRREERRAEKGGTAEPVAAKDREQKGAPAPRPVAVIYGGRFTGRLAAIVWIERTRIMGDARLIAMLRRAWWVRHTGR